MRNIKKYLTSILGVILIFSLTGCSSISENAIKTTLSSKVSSNQNTTEKQPQPTKNISLVNSKAINDKKAVNGNLRVSYIDVGQADSILIEQGTSSMLIDAGNNEDSSTVKNYITKQGITKQIGRAHV